VGGNLIPADNLMHYCSIHSVGDRLLLFRLHYPSTLIRQFFGDSWFLTEQFHFSIDDCPKNAFPFSITIRSPFHNPLNKLNALQFINASHLLTQCLPRFFCGTWIRFLVTSPWTTISLSPLAINRWSSAQ
jgi:hypothetical protein